MGKRHNELDAVTVTISPKDTSGNAYIPTSAKYRLDDCKSCDTLIDWTTIDTPSAEMQVVIAGSINTIKDERCKKEDKVFTVITDENLDTQKTGEYEYQIVRLKFVDS